nr:hypothetical protein [Tanacetum cinerariifolium]
SLKGKRLELVDALERHKVDIACFQETKWKGSSNIKGNGYKLWYSGSLTARNGVGVILKACLKDKVVHVIRCSDRIITLTLVIDGETVNVISAYAPQVGLSEVEKKTFWDSLDKVVREFPTNQRLILGGDLNWHIGAATEGYVGVHGGFGYGMRNEEGRAILDCAIAHDLVVVNSHFKKRDHHLVTFQSGGRCTQIDYLLVRKRDLKACKDCRVFPREACSSQHNLLALDILFKSVQPRMDGSPLSRILWKNLSGDATEAFRSKVAEGVSTRVETLVACDADSMWNAVASIIKDAAKDTLGVAIGTSKTHTARRGSWWLCEEVQAIVAVKQARFRELLSCREVNEEERLRAHERIAKARERKRMDLWDICFIIDEEGRTITDEEKIKKIWGEYFSSLFNAREQEGHEEGLGPSRQPHPEYYSRISQAEVRERQRDLHMAFLDLEKAYDSVPRELIWKTLIDKGSSRRYIKVIRDMYDGAKTRVRTSIENTEFFPVDEDIPWCLIFADDIVLVSESAEECWPITKALANRVEVAKLRMLRWTCGKTLLDMIPNGFYRVQHEVVTIINKMREGRLRWFGHVRRRPRSSPVRIVEALVVDDLRRRGRPKLRWEDRVKYDMKDLLLSEDMTSDRNERRARIRPIVICVVALLLVFLAYLVFCLVDACVLSCFVCLACLMVAFRVCLLVLALLAPVFVCLLCAFVLCVVAFA